MNSRVLAIGDSITIRVCRLMERSLAIVTSRKERTCTAEPLMLSSQNIDSGMSGAPVLDITRNLIVGIIYIAWDSAAAHQDRDTGFAVDARVLSLEPICLELQEDDLPKGLAPAPRTDIQEAR